MGPRFKDMSPNGQILLREWLRLARLYPPDPDEVLPTEFTQALADLARADQSRGRLRHGARQSTTPNRSRQVRRRKTVGALAS